MVEQLVFTVTVSSGMMPSLCEPFEVQVEVPAGKEEEQVKRLL